MMTRRWILIVANPASCRGRGKRVALRLTTRLRTAGVHALVRETRSRGEAERIAREAIACGVSAWSGQVPDCIVACGGDGTVQEVAHALADARPQDGRAPALGLAPAGRCNDFARALGLRRDVDAIMTTLLSGQARPIDLGRVNGRCFCTVVTVGVDAEISDFVDRMRMPLTGTAAYLYGAFRVLGRYRPPRTRITGAFGVVDRPMFIASGANTSSYGGAIPIVPQASPTDGLLDLCLIEHVSRVRMMTLVPAVLRGRHLDEPEVRFVTATHWTVEADPPADLWADGERVATTPATIEVVPSAIEVMLPRARSAGPSPPCDAGRTAAD